MTSVKLLGHSGALTWKQVERGLEISLPDQTPCGYAYVIKVAGRDLKPSDAVRPMAKPASDAR